MMTGMDLFSNIPPWISAIAAAFSALFAGISWYQSNVSKKAKAKAEELHKAALDMRDAAKLSADAAQEKVNQAEKLLEQMQQIVTEQQSQSQSQSKIAASLWRPEFQLTHVQGMWYKLQNMTEQSLNVLEVVNQVEFIRCDDIHQQFTPGESLDIFLCNGWGIPSPSNLILQVAGRDEPIYVQIPGRSS